MTQITDRASAALDAALAAWLGGLAPVRPGSMVCGVTSRFPEGGVSRLKSRALSGLAVLVAGALVAVFCVPRGTSNAATPANLVGSAAENILTVNVQEIDPANKGAVVFNLSEYGNLDWFHLTGVPCSFPYYTSGPAPFEYCKDSAGVPIDRRGGYRAVELQSSGPLTWERLFDGTGSEPGAPAYAGVYENSSPVTYTWNEPDGIADIDLASTSWSSSEPYTPAPQRPGTTLEGAFYDPKSYGGSSAASGYEIEVAHDQDANRVLRFVAGASNSTATIAVEAVDSGGAPVASSVPFYPETLHAAGTAVTALYTVYIPAGYGANIEVTVDSTDPDGYVTLGGAALSGDLAPGGSPLANAKLAFTSSLVRPLTVDTLDA
ncbi:MAG: hypothetical protein LBD90_09260, partial [Bifidobacteriaceae bacterium]|nr:hypothetical protein [Bifidobacteriaceae bacterium]